MLHAYPQIWFHSSIFKWQALVDAPDMVRSQMNFKRLSLTDIKIDIKRVPKKKTLIVAMEDAGGKFGIDNIPSTAL